MCLVCMPWLFLLKLACLFACVFARPEVCIFVCQTFLSPFCILVSLLTHCTISCLEKCLFVYSMVPCLSVCLLFFDLFISLSICMLSCCLWLWKKYCAVILYLSAMSKMQIYEVKKKKESLPRPCFCALSLFVHFYCVLIAACSCLPLHLSVNLPVCLQLT